MLTNFRLKSENFLNAAEWVFFMSVNKIQQPAEHNKKTFHIYEDTHTHMVSRLLMTML